MNHFNKNQNRLEKWRGFYFQLGLIIAGGLTLLAFEWTTTVYVADLPGERIIDIEDPYTPLPEFERKVEKPKIKIDLPKINPTEIEIVKKDEKVSKEEKKEDPNPPIEFKPKDFTPVVPIEVDEPPVYIAGRMPHYADCEVLEEDERKICTQEKMYEHFGKTIRIPEIIKMKGKAIYKAFVYFEVSKTGEIVNVKLLDDKKNSIPTELQREAYNAVKTLPQLIPGKNYGKNVSVRYSVPINFIVQ